MSNSYLFLTIIIEKKEPVFHLDSKEPAKNFKWNNKEFRKSNEFGLISFHDWLRDDDKRIVGVGFSIEEHKKLYKSLAKFNYVKKLSDKNYICIYLGDKKNFSPEWSVDQDYAHHNYYLSEQGKLAFSFRMPNVNEEYDLSLSNDIYEWLKTESVNIEMINN